MPAPSSRTRRPTSISTRRWSATSASSRCRTRPGQSNLRAPAGRGGDRGRDGRPGAGPHPRRDQGSARIRAMPMTARRPASSCWRGRELGLLPRVLRGQALPRHGRAAQEQARPDGQPVRGRGGGEDRRRRRCCRSPRAWTRPGRDRGPVNALAKALAKDLGPYQACIDDMRLVDFKVRITQGGTEAVTRVIIDSEDGAGAALVDRGRLAQHRRRLVRGAAGCDHLEADPRRGAAGVSVEACAALVERGDPDRFAVDGRAADPRGAGAALAALRASTSRSRARPG